MLFFLRRVGGRSFAGGIHDEMSRAPIALHKAPTAIAVNRIPRVGEFFAVDSHA